MGQVTILTRARRHRDWSDEERLEAVQKLDALFAIERDINGKSPAERLATRQELSAPLMAELND
jgi:hypothetical protein